MEEAEFIWISGGSKKNWKQHSLNSPDQYQNIADNVNCKPLSAVAGKGDKDCMKSRPSAMTTSNGLPFLDDAAIRMFRVGKHFGDISALKDISLTIQENDFVFVTGASGAGKSTLIKLLYMGETATEGAIIVDGVNLSRIPRRQVPQLRRKFGVIFQDFKLIPTRTVFDNVALVLEVARIRPDEIKDRVYEVLERAGIADRAKTFPPVLSGGEQQRVAVARAMVGEPKFILADEPTGSLDPDSAGRIFGLLEDAHDLGATVIIATHDSELINAHSGPVIRLENGQMCLDFEN